MKIPRLTYRGGYDAESLTDVINVRLSTIVKNYSFEDFQKLCLNACHLALFSAGFDLEVGASYSLYDLVRNVPGIFSTSMFNFLLNLSNIGLNQKVKESYKDLLQDSLSYELFDFLKCPNIFYAVIAHSYEKEYVNTDSTMWVDLITRGTRLNTLEWERVYRHYMNGGC